MPQIRNHLKKKPWEYVQFKETPTVLVGSRNVYWYDEKRLEGLRNTLKPLGITFYWDPSTNTQKNNQKQSTMIECYAMYPKDMPFMDKVKEMENVMKNFPF